MARDFTLKKGSRVWIGNYPFVLMQDTKGIFETVVDSPDVLAEVLAQNPALYAAHRADLEHEEDSFENVTVQRMQKDGKPVLGPLGTPVYDIEAKPIKVRVSYGLNGQRIEHKPDEEKLDAKKVAKEQEKNVAEADKEAQKQAKLDEKLRKDDELRGTPLEVALEIREKDKEFAKNKGVADAEARRNLEIAEHNRPAKGMPPVT